MLWVLAIALIAVLIVIPTIAMVVGTLIEDSDLYWIKMRDRIFGPAVNDWQYHLYNCICSKCIPRINTKEKT